MKLVREEFGMKNTWIPANKTVQVCFVPSMRAEHFGQRAILLKLSSGRLSSFRSLPKLFLFSLIYWFFGGGFRWLLRCKSSTPLSLFWGMNSEGLQSELGRFVHPVERKKQFFLLLFLFWHSILFNFLTWRGQAGAWRLQLRNLLASQLCTR